MINIVGIRAKRATRWLENNWQYILQKDIDSFDGQSVIDVCKYHNMVVGGNPEGDIGDWIIGFRMDKLIKKEVKAAKLKMHTIFTGTIRPTLYSNVREIK